MLDPWMPSPTPLYLEDLYQILQKRGYKYLKYPSRYIDKLSAKYTFFKWFHTTKYLESKDALCKGGINVYFDDWCYVDICYNGKNIVFKNNQGTTTIIEHIKQLEREIKLKRII